MNNKKEKRDFPTRKISESFLEFSMPMIEALGENPTRREIEKILQVTYTVWNSTIIDKVNKNSKLISMLRESVKNDFGATSIIENLISRKNEKFYDDLRLIGEYKLKEEREEWRLQVEAKDPFLTR